MGDAVRSERTGPVLGEDQIVRRREDPGTLHRFAGEKAQEKEVVVDTTTQEKSIAFSRG
jgi:hypothetical protein